MDEEQKDEPDRQAHDTPGGQAEGGPDCQAGTNRSPGREWGRSLGGG